MNAAVSGTLPLDAERTPWSLRLLERDLARARIPGRSANTDARAHRRRARLGDSDRILELGCGWGSLWLWMA